MTQTAPGSADRYLAAESMPGVTKQEGGRGHVGLTSRPVRPPAEGEVVVEVHAAGVCGTDLHIEDGEFPVAAPVTMGHEVSGVVMAVGPGVDVAWQGRRVACETYFATCGRCRYCRTGRINLCPGRRSIGSHVDGGFAPLVVVPARNLHPVPDGVGEHAAALCEPLACVCHCLADPPLVGPGDRVLVVGPGTMGLLAAQVARAAGGRAHVVGTPGDAPRLGIAEALGFATSSGAWAGLPDWADRGADVVVECSGSQGGAALALAAARPGGRYVQVGLFGRDATLPLDELCYREIVWTSGFASTPESWARAMRLLESGAVGLDPLVSAVAPLAAWQRVFADTRAGRGMKFVFDPRLDAADGRAAGPGFAEARTRVKSTREQG